MNAQEAKQKIEKNVDYKYVVQLVPPMLAMAKMSLGISHAKIGYDMGWVEIDRSVRPPFKIKDPDNFKAGRLKVEEDGTVKNTGISTDFSDRKNIFSSEEALQDFFEIADITLVE